MYKDIHSFAFTSAKCIIQTSQEEKKYSILFGQIMFFTLGWSKKKSKKRWIHMVECHWYVYMTVTQIKTSTQVSGSWSQITSHSSGKKKKRTNHNIVWLPDPWGPRHSELMKASHKLFPHTAHLEEEASMCGKVLQKCFRHTCLRQLEKDKWHYTLPFILIFVCVLFSEKVTSLLIMGFKLKPTLNKLSQLNGTLKKVQMVN